MYALAGVTLPLTPQTRYRVIAFALWIECITVLDFLQTKCQKA